MERTARVLWITLAVGSVSAYAQPSTVEPDPDPEAEAPEKPAYSRALAERPLLLPDGFEVGTDFWFRNDKSVLYAGSARIETSAFELSFGLAYVLSDQNDGDAKLDRIFIAGVREVAPCYVPQLVAGVQLVGGQPFGDLASFAPSVVAQYKRTFAPWFALQPFGSFGYELTQAVDSISGWESNVHGLAAMLGTRAQLQISPVIAFEGRAALAYRQDLADYTAVGLTSFGSQLLGGTLLISASENADVFISYDATVRDGSRGAETIALGLTIRRL